MQFWSKGLGKKRIGLYLSKGETISSAGSLYVKGQMEAPVDWDYIMPLQSVDIIDFFELLKDPSVAAYVHSSPRRWELYRTMLSKGLGLGLMVLGLLLRQATGRIQEEPEVLVEVPPPSVLRKKKAGGAEKKKRGRKRLSKRTTSAPSLTSGMAPVAAPAFILPDAEDDEDCVDDAIQDAIDTASQLG